jgi:hypothetical protein
MIFLKVSVCSVKWSNAMFNTDPHKAKPVPSEDFKKKAIKV